jgi:hypothetical protein
MVKQTLDRYPGPGKDESMRGSQLIVRDLQIKSLLVTKVFCQFLANFEAQKIRASAQIGGLNLRRKFVTLGCAPHENHSLYARRD